MYNNLENEAFYVRSNEDNFNRLVFMKIKSSIENLFATYVANMNFWTMNSEHPSEKPNLTISHKNLNTMKTLKKPCNPIASASNTQQLLHRIW